MLEQNINYSSFVTDVSKISNHLGIDFYEILVTRKAPQIDAIFDELEVIIHRDLAECVQFWNIGTMRKRLVDILESNIPRPTT